MSGSETGVNVMPTTNREPFSAGGVIQKGTVQPSVQNMRLVFSADGTAVYKPIIPTSPSYQPPEVAVSSGGDDVSGGGSQLPGQGLNMNVGSEQMKRKRGRPRKYGPDGSMSLALVPFPSSAARGNHQSGGGFSSPRVASAGGSASPNSMKKVRGRPLGSGRKRQLETLGSVGVGFTPHVITVKTGEDVSSKIMSFSQHGPRAVCILSVNGAISNVTLRQAATSGGTVTYEGRFEILSLSGSFLLSENGGQRSRTGGLSVSLSGPDGRVLGGGVAGLLTAATPVQVVVGTFIADDGHGRKESKSFHRMEASAAPLKLAPGSVPAVTNSPPSRGTLSESSGGTGSPLNQSSVACNNNNNHQQGMATSMPWK